MPRLAILALSLCVLPSAALALETAAEIQDCINGNLPEESSQQQVVFQSRDRGGDEKTSNATIYWKKFPDGYSKVLLRVSGPPRLRGTGLLMIEKEEGNDRFLYMPKLKKVRRITQSNSSSSERSAASISRPPLKRALSPSESVARVRARRFLRRLRRPMGSWGGGAG